MEPLGIHVEETQRLACVVSLVSAIYGGKGVGAWVEPWLELSAGRSIHRNSLMPVQFLPLD